MLYGISFWLPTLIVGLGITDVVQVGLVGALPSLAAIVVMVIFGFVSDRAGERTGFLIAAFAMSGCGLLLCVLAAGYPVVGILGLCLANAGALSVPAIFWSWQTSMLTGTALAGGIAFINSTGNLAGFAAPYLVGFLKDLTGVTNVALLMCAVVAFIGVVATLLVRRKLAGKRVRRRGVTLPASPHVKTGSQLE